MAIYFPMEKPHAKDRYLRQTLLSEIGKEGQEALKNTKVLCVGAGGLGSPALLYLAAAGIGKIGIIDPDDVSLSNLQRQILFSTPDEGKKKALLSKEKLSALNPEISLEAYPVALDEKNIEKLFSEYDIILDCTDNFHTKFLINDAAVKLSRPVIYGSLSRLEGRASVFWAKHGPCYRCLYPKLPEASIFNCELSGVIGATAGIIGTIQAMETIKVALTLKQGSSQLKSLLGKLLLLDSASMDFQKIALSKNPTCPICSKNPDEIIFKSYEETKELSPSDFLKLQESEDLFLLDVREEDEWKEGHIPGAINIPLSCFEKETWENLKGQKNIVLYCRSGNRSRRALDYLKKEGVSVSYHLTYGILSYSGPLESMPR